MKKKRREHEGVHFHRKELSNVSPFCDIGAGTVVHSHVWIGQAVRIGKDCRIQAFAFIPTGVEIADGAFIGPRVCFTNDKKPPSRGRNWSRTVVCRGAVVGAGAVVLPGVTIGENAVVGAGAVVVEDVAPGTTVVGNPAKPLTYAHFPL